MVKKQKSKSSIVTKTNILNVEQVKFDNFNYVALWFHFIDNIYLYYLSKPQEKLTLSELYRILSQKNIASSYAYVTKLLRRLEDYTKTENSGRVTYVTLTPRGVKIALLIQQLKKEMKE